MELSVSILSIKENLNNKLTLLDSLNISYLHIDVEDGIFVPNIAAYYDVLKDKSFKHPLDIHLMVEDVYKYIDIYSRLEPKYLTFHKEATNNTDEIIEYIKSKNIKVGLSINPETKVKVIKKYLSKLDLVLVMSVNPGAGSQKLIKSTYRKIKQLKKLQKKYDFVIEVDGGINDTNVNKLNADICVIGSFITKSNNYEDKINLINEKIKSF